MKLSKVAKFEIALLLAIIVLFSVYMTVNRTSISKSVLVRNVAFFNSSVHQDHMDMILSDASPRFENQDTLVNDQYGAFMSHRLSEGAGVALIDASYKGLKYKLSNYEKLTIYLPDGLDQRIYQIPAAYDDGLIVYYSSGKINRFKNCFGYAEGGTISVRTLEQEVASVDLNLSFILYRSGSTDDPCPRKTVRKHVDYEVGRDAFSMN